MPHFLPLPIPKPVVLQACPPGLLRVQLSRMTHTPHGASPLNSSRARSELPGGDNCPPGEMAGRRRELLSFAQRTKKQKKGKPDVHSHGGHDLVGGGVVLSGPDRHCWGASTLFPSVSRPPGTKGWQSLRGERPLRQEFPLPQEHWGCTTPGSRLDWPLQILGKREGGRFSSAPLISCAVPALLAQFVLMGSGSRVQYLFGQLALLSSQPQTEP